MQEDIDYFDNLIREEMKRVASDKLLGRLPFDFKDKLVYDNSHAKMDWVDVKIGNQLTVPEIPTKDNPERFSRAIGPVVANGLTRFHNTIISGWVDDEALKNVQISKRELPQALAETLRQLERPVILTQVGSELIPVSALEACGKPCKVVETNNLRVFSSWLFVIDWKEGNIPGLCLKFLRFKEEVDGYMARFATEVQPNKAAVRFILKDEDVKL